MMPDDVKVSKINELMSSMSVSERLVLVADLYPKAVFTTSLGREDQMLLWNIATHAPSLRTVTLNTGRLFPETLELLAETRALYGIEIGEIDPDPAAIDVYVKKHGQNGFYDSVAARKLCCGIRKVEPLQRALKGADAWITGLTREQSAGRSDIPLAEWDDTHQLVKFNPLADVSSREIEAVIAAEEIPVNALHARGYPSIGCDPCTRAIKPGEHPRAGRWWWENESSSECGLHVAAAPKPHGQKTPGVREHADA